MSYRDAVAHFLRAHPNEWVDGLELARIGGAYAWRSRLAETRTQLGMTVENRQRKVGRRTVSEYRYVPSSLLEIADGGHIRRWPKEAIEKYATDLANVIGDCEFSHD